MKQTGDPVWDEPAPKRPKRLPSWSPGTITSIEVTRIGLIKTNTTDTVFIETTLPPAIWPFEEPATMKVGVARGKAEDWLQEAFPDVEYDVVDARS